MDHLNLKSEAGSHSEGKGLNNDHILEIMTDIRLDSACIPNRHKTDQFYVQNPPSTASSIVYAQPA